MEIHEGIYVLAFCICAGSAITCVYTVNLQTKHTNMLHQQIDILNTQLEIEHGIVEINETRLRRVEDVVFPARTGPHVH